jgi:hypothetical protein
MTFVELKIRLLCYLRSPSSTFCRAVRCLGFKSLPEGWGRFPRSRLARELLSGLEGLEIGGSAANDFGLRTRNVDVCNHLLEDTIYAAEQRRLCGQVMPVDLLAPGDQLSVLDASVDFVISSHAIEHFYDPVRTIVEWVRVSRRYVYIVAPHRDRMFDRNRPVSTPVELIERYARPRPRNADCDAHWSVWRTQDFVDLIKLLRLPIAAVQDSDDKIGNGFTVVIGDLAQFDRSEWAAHVATLVRDVQEKDAVAASSGSLATT